MIAMAKQRDTFVEVYDENNHQIFCRIGKLYGYTSHTVTIKDYNDFLVTWDHRGNWKSSRHE